MGKGELRMNNNAYVELGYVFTFTAAAIVLVAVVGSTGILTRESNRAMVGMVLEDIAEKLADGVEEALWVAENLPKTSFNRTVSFPSQISGETGSFRYKINVSDNSVICVNSGGMVAKRRVHNPGKVSISGEVEGFIIVKRVVTAHYTTVKITYTKEDNKGNINIERYK